LVETLRQAITAAGAKMQLIAPIVGGVTTATGEVLAADHKMEGGPSVLFDAVVLAPSVEGGAKLALQAEAVDFLRDAYGHLKVIGYLPTVAPMMVKAGIDAKPDNDPGLVSLELSSVDDFLTRAAAGRVWEREPWVRLVP
jgi:catalase